MWAEMRFIPDEVPEGYVRIFDGHIDKSTDLVWNTNGYWQSFDQMSKYELSECKSNDVDHYWGVCRPL